MFLPLEEIRTDGGTQPREGLDATTVQEYADAMRNGDIFPPVTVYNDGEHYWLADGFHRHAASTLAEFEEISCDIHQGTQRDAVLHSCSANAAHGLRRTNDDKRRAVRVLLHDPEWSQWSDREISRRCSVGNRLVSDMRRELCPDHSTTRKYTRNGEEYTMDTAAIGDDDIPADSDRKTYPISDIHHSDGSKLVVSQGLGHLSDPWYIFKIKPSGSLQRFKPIPGGTLAETWAQLFHYSGDALVRSGMLTSVPFPDVVSQTAMELIKENPLYDPLFIRDNHTVWQFKYRNSRGFYWFLRSGSGHATANLASTEVRELCTRYQEYFEITPDGRTLTHRPDNTDEIPLDIDANPDEYTANLVDDLETKPWEPPPTHRISATDPSTAWVASLDLTAAANPDGPNDCGVYRQHLILALDLGTATLNKKLALKIRLAQDEDEQWGTSTSISQHYGHHGGSSGPVVARDMHYTTAHAAILGGLHVLLHNALAKLRSETEALDTGLQLIRTLDQHWVPLCENPILTAQYSTAIQELAEHRKTGKQPSPEEPDSTAPSPTPADPDILLTVGNGLHSALLEYIDADTDEYNGIGGAIMSRAIAAIRAWQSTTSTTQ